MLKQFNGIPLIKSFNHFQVIGSSLLCICDNTDIRIWMIDFANIIHIENHQLDHLSKWELGNHEDGYLAGIDNLINVPVSDLLFFSSPAVR
jgi:1D-myo-inositol-triphosphate 3-kinase